MVAPQAAEASTAAFLKMLDSEHYLREYERLALCRAALAMPASAQLAEAFLALVTTDSSDLVRARALLAWGLHSAQDEFAPADAFWESTSNTWKAYLSSRSKRKHRNETAVTTAGAEKAVTSDDCPKS